MDITEKSLHDGQKFYTGLTLVFYDWIIYFNNTAFWKVKEADLQKLYDTNISDMHLDIGVGTSRLIDRNRLQKFRRLALADLNSSSLQNSAKRLDRFLPEVFQCNVLETLPIDGKFTSVAANYLLHCIPGHGFKGKRSVFVNIHEMLQDGGVFFGSTLCAKDTGTNKISYKVFSLFNKFGWFHNMFDSDKELEVELKSVFTTVTIYRIGEVAFFTAIK